MESITTEQWAQWKPINKINKELRIDLIIDSIDGFKIHLFDEDDREMILNFGLNAASYRVTEEICSMEVQGEIFKKNGPDFCLTWMFFKVINSSYVQQLTTDPSNNAVINELKHFVIFDTDFMIDIITTDEPVVSWR